jgi:hypothetical protein
MRFAHLFRSPSTLTPELFRPSLCAPSPKLSDPPSLDPGTLGWELLDHSLCLGPLHRNCSDFPQPLTQNCSDHSLCLLGPFTEIVQTSPTPTQNCSLSLCWTFHRNCSDLLNPLTQVNCSLTILDLFTEIVQTSQLSGRIVQTISMSWDHPDNACPDQSHYMTAWTGQLSCEVKGT